MVSPASISNAEVSTVGTTRGLVSGRFHGYGEKPMEPYDRPLRLDLRVDVSNVDGFEDRRVLNILSGDLFLHNQYLVTFRLRVDPGAVTAVIEGDADIIIINKNSGEQVTDKIRVEYDYEGEICKVGDVAYYMTYASPHFRFLNVELDYSQGLTESDAIVRESEEIMARYFVKAGFDCRVNDGLSDSGPVPGNPAGGWTTFEMNEIQKRHFKAHANDIQWPKFSLYGLLLSRFTQSGVVGIIYDTDDAEQRQGFAVFVEEIRRILGNPLRVGNSYRTLEHTLIHEGGHALNLAHSFLPKKGRADALSWMNYPQRYSDPANGKQGSADFWQQFVNVRDFDLKELETIRHGPLNWIIPGGIDWDGFGVTLTSEKNQLPIDKIPFKGCSDGEMEGGKSSEHVLSVYEAYGIKANN